MDDVLRSGYYESLLGYDNVYWLVDEALKLQNKLAFYFTNTDKDFIMIEQDEQQHRDTNICRLCEEKMVIWLETIVF